MSEIRRKIKIWPDGIIEIIYFDELKGVDLPIQTIRRASHVEPDGNGDWTADMRPSGGPILGPFTTRQVALQEEVKWLEEVYMKKGAEDART